MRKYISVSLLLLLTISLAAFAGGKGKGAVKSDLVQYYAPYSEVGGVIFNTNADDQLIVTSHINKGVPYGTVHIEMFVYGIGYFWGEYMNLDEDGGGSGQIIWDIPPEFTDLEGIWVWVYLHINFYGTGPYDLYLSGWEWVPVKN